MKKKVKCIPLEDVLNEELKDPEFRFYFEKRQAVGQIAQFVRDSRRHAGLTQTELAKRAGTSQSVIARLESGNDSRIPSMDLLHRIAFALSGRLVITLERKKAA